MNNKHKDLMLENENVLKFFIYNKLVSNRSSEPQTQNLGKHIYILF